MGTFLIILIILFLIGPYVWRRWIQPWLIIRAQRKMEDYIRAAAGMPPREKKSAGGASNKKSKSSEGNAAYSYRRRSYSPTPGPIIPKEYAVDVEYTEIKEYSATVEISGQQHGHSSRDGRRVVVEEQVSDVEYSEIRIK